MDQQGVRPILVYHVIFYHSDGSIDLKEASFPTRLGALGWFRRMLRAGVPAELWCGETLLAKSTADYMPDRN